MNRIMLLMLTAAFNLVTYAQNTGNIYRIRSASPTGEGKYVTAMDNKLNAAIELADKDDSNEYQLWAIVAPQGVENGCAFYNIGTKMSIDMAPTVTKDRYKLLHWNAKFNENQMFEIHSPGIAGSAIQLISKAENDRVLTKRDDFTLWMDQDMSDEDTYFELEEVKDYSELNFPVPFVSYNIISYSHKTQLSNRLSMENDAPIYSDPAEDGNKGQNWVLKVPQYYVDNDASFKNNTFQLYNTYSGKSFDGAFDNPSKGILQWTTALNNNINQFFTIEEVSDKENVYQIYGQTWGWRYDYGWIYDAISHYVKVNADGTVATTEDNTDTDTYFYIQAADPFLIPDKPYWQNEVVYEKNKEKGHATYIPYSDTESLRTDARYDKAWLDPEKSDRWISLNGTWKLDWREVPGDLTLPGEEVYGDDVDISSWNDITVPGCLEMQGYGIPYYINVNYPFNDNPPYIVTKAGLKNTVATYRRDFVLPEGWESERTLIHFDGAYSCIYLYVNGQSVGYSEGSNNDAEFDITNYVHTGKNNVTVQVIRYTDASYLEGQDMWHMSGIHRDVYLVSVPRTFVRDHFIRTKNQSDDAKSGCISVDMVVDNRDKKTCSKKIEVRFISPEGIPYASDTKDVEFADGENEKSVNIEFSCFTNLKPWTADSPTLYTIEVIQKNESNEEEMAFATKYGFCKADIKYAQFRINGKRIFLKGVNTQDTHPLKGRTMDEETMWQDLTMMKQANVNCVRTSHYPRSPKMNSMMDYLGLYQIDEADVECHKNWSDNGNIHTSTTWRAPIVDREVRMVMRDRNHPSVICWSLGNESNGGVNFNHAYDAVRSLDDRPIHYEGATRAGTSPSDINSYMYSDVNNVISRANGSSKPHFLCEYAHAMGNSVGNLSEYWEAIESSQNGMGGCIWDWVDQSIVDYEDIVNGELKVNGFNKYRNGWDHTPSEISQGNFVNNGIITADRAWTGKLDEVRRVYQYVKFSDKLTDGNIVGLRQGYETLTLKGYHLKYSVLKNGETVESGSVVLPDVNVLTEYSPTKVEIPYSTTFEPEAEYLLNLSVCVPEATEWCEEGYAIAKKQYILQERGTLQEMAKSGKPLTYENGVIGNDKISIKVRTTGSVSEKGIYGWEMNGISVIPEGTVPDYSNYRWIENDAPYGTDQKYSTDNGITSKYVTVSLAEDGSTATIRQNGTGTLCNYDFLYTVYSNGTVDLSASYMPITSSLRRLGMGMQFSPELMYTQYYARGPRSNTIDRKTGSDIGIYSLPVRQYHVDYVAPQTSGDRQDMRWLILYNKENKGIRIDSEGQVNFSLDNYDDAFMHNYIHSHPWCMPESNDIYAHFDYMQLGIGNASCGAGVLDKYKIPSSGKYTYKLRFTYVDDVETSVDGLVVDESIANRIKPGQSIYNLNGQLVGNTSLINMLKPGTYVTDGRKFVIK